MGHDYVDYAGRTIVFRDPMLNLCRCIMHRLAHDPAVNIPYQFRPPLCKALDEFYYVCGGVFTNFALDTLLQSDLQVRSFLDFLDICATFVVEHGPILPQSLLNELVGDSDDWRSDVNIQYPLLGFGRLANLIVNAPPCVGNGVLSIWAFDELTPRMKQERLREHRLNS
jgi:hypothetical protein